MKRPPTFDLYALTRLIKIFESYIAPVIKEPGFCEINQKQIKKVVENLVGKIDLDNDGLK